MQSGQDFSRQHWPLCSINVTNQILVNLTKTRFNRLHLQRRGVGLSVQLPSVTGSEVSMQPTKAKVALELWGGGQSVHALSTKIAASLNWDVLRTLSHFCRHDVKKIETISIFYSNCMLKWYFNNLNEIYVFKCHILFHIFYCGY